MRLSMQDACGLLGSMRSGRGDMGVQQTSSAWRCNLVTIKLTFASTTPQERV